MFRIVVIWSECGTWYFIQNQKLHKNCSGSDLTWSKPYDKLQFHPICTCAILYKHHYSSVLTALSTFLSIKSFPFSSSAVSVPGAWVSVASMSVASVVGASVSGGGSQSTWTQHMHFSLHCTAVVHSLYKYGDIRGEVHNRN